MWRFRKNRTQKKTRGHKASFIPFHNGNSREGGGDKKGGGISHTPKMPIPHTEHFNNPFFLSLFSKIESRQIFPWSRSRGRRRREDEAIDGNRKRMPLFRSGVSLEMTPEKIFLRIATAGIFSGRRNLLWESQLNLACIIFLQKSLGKCTRNNSDIEVETEIFFYIFVGK